VSWRVAVDVGGTFTDLVAWDPGQGTMLEAKVLTVHEDPVRGVADAVERSGVPLETTEAFVHGTTIAINAVLEGRGAITALLTTRGFRDVLEMGRKNRPDMYNLFFRPRMCPVPRQRRVEVGERLDSRGQVLQPLDSDELETVVRSLPEDVEALAICFLHSYANPQHEEMAAAQARSLRPDLYVSPSQRLSREMGEYERTSTAVVNAYVGPLVSRYTHRLASFLGEGGCRGPLLITQSNGGVMTAEVAEAQPVRMVESGPAAGVTGAGWLGRGWERRDLIAFDMGGTSAKACMIENGEPEVSPQYFIGGRVSGMPVQVQFLDIVEVGAGGGSIADLDGGGGLRVGPRSAGSQPGPAAYGLGGEEPTVTDANVVLGRIGADYFLGGAMRLHPERARRAVMGLAERLELGAEECALGIITVANAVMASAIRAVTVERGRDPRELTMVAYGGAGPVHAGSLAAELSIPNVIVPARAGTFAAFGMLTTDLRHDVTRALVRRLDALPPEEAESIFGSLETEAGGFIAERLGGFSENVRHVRKLDLRYVGQFHVLTLSIGEGGVPFRVDEVTRLFHEAHALRYGHQAPAEPVEVCALRVSAVSAVVKPDGPVSAGPGARGSSHVSDREVWFDDGSHRRCAVHRRDRLEAGAKVEGPAIIEDTTTNVLLGPQDRASVLDGGHLLIRVGAVRR
jgi:N-methylhydantoinase A